MDANTLHKLTSQVDLDRCVQLLPGLYHAFDLAKLDTAERRAMWFAQVLEESIGLSATTELASGEEYEGRADLGNTEVGDGPRFKGRGFIQLTGRSHYQEFSHWCHRHGLVANNHWFVEHFDDVADDDFAWLSAAWYWLQPHPHDGMTFLNEAADAGNLLTATHMVNGGENGLETRKLYFNKATGLGTELMTPVDPTDPNWSDLMTEEELNKCIDGRLHALMFGDDDLHGNEPQLFAKDGDGLDARLAQHNTRIKGHNKRLEGHNDRLHALEHVTEHSAVPTT
jgi:putative chitinase